MDSETAMPGPDQAYWRSEQAGQLSVIIDGADYFVALRQALLQARHSVMLVGWDFDTRITFGTPDDGGPVRLGDFILWLANRTPGLQIRLLRWGNGALAALLRGNTLFTILRWKAHPRITLKLDARHPLGSSHHQKIVAIDDSIAFCGGIDLMMQRWDTRDHADQEPRRRSPMGRAEPPWHDVTTAFDGAAARAIGDLARNRWRAATDETLPPCDHPHSCWPGSLTPDFRDMQLAIARTLPRMDTQDPVHEVEDAWIAMIHSARRHVYAESQYFASRRIAHAIAERLVEDDPPEFVIINPHTADGWLEPLAMDTARATLAEALSRIDHRGRFRIYHPQTTQGQPIYVHSKVMMVDERFLRVGSSNFNNRSMRLDSECDVILDAADPANVAHAARIAGLRDSLMAEHLGVPVAEVTQMLKQTGSLIASIESLRGAGRSLVPYERPQLNRFQAWLAENEILDPNGPEEMFERPGRRGLLKGWGRLRRRRIRRA